MGIRAVGAILLVYAALGRADEALLDRAREEYRGGRYGAAVELLQKLPEKSAAAWALLGESLYSQGKYRQAFHALEKAVSAEPGNARYWNRLGKAYGRQAETGSPLKAFGLARKCRDAFERSVELDPSDLESQVDLFSYYLDAPGFLGGGEQKAEAVAARIGELSAAEHQFVLAKLASRRKDWAAAEQRYRQAMALEPERVGRVLDLASFLASRGRAGESAALLDRAAQMDPGNPRIAEIRRRLVSAKRKP